MATAWIDHPERHVLDQTVYVNGSWTVQKVDPLKLDAVIVAKLKICTYNIFFGNERQKLRMQHILKIMEDNNVDIFCFQEVTQTLLQYILCSTFIQKYYVSGITRDDTGSYGNVIFSRFPLVKAYINHYQNTGMGRKLVCVDVIINNELFRFGTVHLESLPLAAKKRVVQLKDTMKFMLEKQETFQRPQHLMIMGDFNECATKHKKALPMIDKQFLDAWAQYYGGYGTYEKNNPGWTMPENDYFPPWRPDRLYYAFNYDYSELDKLMKEKETGDGSLDSDEEVNAECKNHESDKKKKPKKKKARKKKNRKDKNENENEEEKKEEFKYEMNGNKGAWVLKHIVRVGMDKIPKTKQEEENGSRVTVFTPSDHYGLIAEFVCFDIDVEEMTQIVKSRKFDT